MNRKNKLQKYKNLRNFSEFEIFIKIFPWPTLQPNAYPWFIVGLGLFHK